MRELISSTFAAAWATAQPTVPLILENEAIPTGDTQALLTIVPTTSRQVTQGRTGARRVQRQGWIQVKLWTLANAGTATMAGLADAVGDVIEMIEIPDPTGGEPIVTQAAAPGPSGNSSDGRWFMGTVRVPFRWGDQK